MLTRLIQTLIAWGPFGLFVLAIADSAGVPAIGGVDALLIALSANRPNLAYPSALCAIAGSLIGASILFAVARKGGQVFLDKYIGGGTGRRLHAWFQQYGLVTVFVPAMSPLPMPMKIPVFCAGALEVRWGAFLGVMLAARVIRYFALAYLAQKYGSATLGFLRTHWGAVLMLASSLAIAAVIAIRLTRKEMHARG